MDGKAWKVTAGVVGFLLIVGIFIAVVYVAVVRTSKANSGGAARTAVQRAVAPMVKKATSAFQGGHDGNAYNNSFGQNIAESANELFHLGEDISNDASGGMRNTQSEELSDELRALLDSAAEGFVGQPLGGNGAAYDNEQGGDRHVLDGLLCMYPKVCETICTGKPVPAEYMHNTQQYEAFCPCDTVRNCMETKNGHLFV